MNTGPSIAPPDEPDPGLGRVVRRLRESQGLSRAELADRSQIDPATLSHVEDGAVDPPWATVKAIASGLGVSVQHLADAVVQRDEPSDR